MGKTGRFTRVNPAKNVHFTRANQAKNVHFARVGKPRKNCPFYPRGQTKIKLSILPEWVNSVKNVHFTRVGKPSKNCPFYPRLSILVDQSIHSTKLVIPPGTICTKHEIILARVSTLQLIARRALLYSTTTFYTVRVLLINTLYSLHFCLSK